MKTIAPYGSWTSPITAELIAEGGKQLNEIRVDGSDIYWLEGRPSEGGRNVIVRRSADGEIADVTPEGFNVRNAVHEYGGGSYAVKDGSIYFSSWEDQRVYVQRNRSEATSLTEVPSLPRGLRYADLTVSTDGKNLLCVRESHHASGAEADNELVAIDTTSGDQKLVASGRDFYSDLRISNDGSDIAWLEWDHPNMPWDSDYLVRGVFEDLPSATVLNEGDGESIIQPRWGKDGQLHFISDRTGWWNLYVWRNGEAVNLLEREFDAGGPSWRFGMSSYDFVADGKIALARGGVASGIIYVIDGPDHVREVEVPYSDIASLNSYDDGASVVFIGASPSMPPSIVKMHVESGLCEVLASSSDLQIGDDYLSTPKHITFSTTDDGIAHAYYYEPRNSEYEGPDDELPPLVVISHGGPTSSSGTSLDLSKQFWTSRGFGVVDVNYRGSTGHGRAYREALKLKWGVYDVDDCIAAAEYLAETGEVDRHRSVIRGGSAGGYTTINSLVFRDYFVAGASYYGLSDLKIFIGITDDDDDSTEDLATHKFESRYLDSLVGPWPEAEQVYYDRSAINFMDQLSTPMIILQGDEDEIVPPSQAEVMVEALDSKGLPYAYLLFEGEQHGFRQAATIIRAQLAELAFYGKVLGFEPADDIGEDVVDIKNLG